MIDQKFIDFIEDHHVLTLATSIDNKPWCANCFYTYLKNKNWFVFTSDNDTRHASEALSNKYVAASIVLETSVIGKIQGLQIEGELVKAEGEELALIKKAYLKKYPFAVLMKTNLWYLKPKYYKLTDNRLGFGKKLVWNHE